MKHFIEFLRENDAGGATNVTAGVETTPTPSFTTKRWGGQDEYEVDHEVYLKLRHGRDRHERWSTKVECGFLQSAIQGSLYKNGSCLVTSKQTGAAVFLKHARIQRQKYDDDVALN